MDKTYDPHAIEQRWYHIWEENEWFAPRRETQENTHTAVDPVTQTPHTAGNDATYCIMIPPPNVTGSLHMGHGFNNTIMDSLIRYHRMKGDKTLWQPGSDHAGIATQMVVERQLEAEGKTRHDLGRQAFIKRVWEWKTESGGNITRQLRRLGSSLDWQHERFTMDDGLSESVKEVFVQLFEEGLIYRGKRLVNWDPKLHTAISDLEVLSEEEQGHMWYIRYPLSNGRGHLVVSTTRPETLLGDCAVAVNPEDERYKSLLGESLELPLSGRLIPIIADEHADPALGTGCVKITPAHDFNDYAVWQRHRDELAIVEQIHGGLINIFTVDAAIRANETDEGKLIPAKYIGLDRYQARKQIVADLEMAGLLEKIVDHTLMVPRGDRSAAVIEPFLTDQWYVKVAPLAGPAIEAVESGRIRFVPDNWKNTYYEWMHNIQDWCISRQIWWGHRIPAWYDDTGNVYVGRSEQEVRDKHGFDTAYPLRQDEDVLDTWFSSALWPFSTLGWPQESTRLNTFYPTSVLVTGFDIIFFWVARMIMMGLKFMHDVPFHEVYVHGLVRDSHGHKMSKSKGNVLDPIDLIDGIELEDLVAKRLAGMMQPQLAKKIERQTRKEFPQGIPAFGTDALRFTFASLASTGRDISFDLGRIEGYRNFCNKLWNAANYVLINTQGKDCGVLPDTETRPDKHTADILLSPADRWITSRLQRVTQQVNEAIDGYRFDLAASAIYEFTWDEYCAWYLELSKPVLNAQESPRSAGDGMPGASNDADRSKARQRGTRRTLAGVLESILRLAHPIMPYITEEIWQKVAPLINKYPSSPEKGQENTVRQQTIMLQPYPIADQGKIDMAAEQEMQWVMNFIIGVRKIRSGMNIKPSQALPVLLQNGSAQDRTWLETNRHTLASLARTESITWLEPSELAPESATSLVGTMKLLVPMVGLIDKQAELLRLDKEIGKLMKDLMRIEGKLGNENFITRAPAAVVDKEKTKLAEIQTSLSQLQGQRSRIASI